MEAKKIIEELLLERDAEVVNYSTDEAIKNHKERCDYLIGLLDKQEQGLLIDVPVKPEDTVYIIVKKDISPQKVIEIHISCNGIEIITNRRAFHISAFGETVFLTRSEAEEALAKMGE